MFPNNYYFQPQVPNYNQNIKSNNNYNNYQNNNIHQFYDVNEAFEKGNIQRSTYQGYKRFVPKMPIFKSEREKLLLEIQKYSFYLHELNLFLNTHPNDTQSIEVYNNTKPTLDNLMSEYQNHYGPIDLESASLNKTPWAWNNQPWPWEKGN